MNKKVKALLLVLCALILVVGSVMGTLAYLTDTKTVENTFTVGNVAISMVETKVNEYGEVLTDTDAGTTTGPQTYKLLPGHTYVKDPTITVTAGSEQCWLFVEVVNGISAYEASANTIAYQLEANNWLPVDSTNYPGLYYHAVVDARTAAQPVSVFGEFTIDTDANNKAGWSSVTPTDTKVTVTAYAIQADGLSTYTAAAAALGLITVTP